MAPEQVRGQALDARADAFPVGAILHEMLSGRRAFQRDTAAGTMTAILKDDPRCQHFVIGHKRLVHILRGDVDPDSHDVGLTSDVDRLERAM